MSSFKWRQTQDGWAITPIDGVSGDIKITRSGSVRFSLTVSGRCASVAHAQARVESLLGELGLDVEGRPKVVNAFPAPLGSPQAAFSADGCQAKGRNFFG